MENRLANSARNVYHEIDMDDDKKKTKGVGRGNSPNSLKNLKPVQPGEVRNPLGGKTHGPEVKAMRKLTAEFLKQMIEIAASSDVAELTRISNDPKSTVTELMVARCLHKAIKDQDWSLFDRIIERLVGKVPDKVDHTSGGEKIPGGNFTVTFVKPETK